MTNNNNNNNDENENVDEDEEEELPDSSRAVADGFTLFSSDQLDLLSSVRSNWNKSCPNDSFEATLMAAGGGGSYFGPRQGKDSIIHGKEMYTLRADKMSPDKNPL